MKQALAAAQSQHTDQIQGLENEIEALNVQLHTAMNDQSSHHSELSLSLVKMRTLHDNEKLEWNRAAMVAKEEEQGRHRDAVEMLEGKILELQATVAEHTAQASTLQEDLYTSHQVTDDLTEQLRNTQQQHQEAIERWEKAEKELETFRDKERDLMLLMEEKKTEGEEMMRQYQQLQQDHEELLTSLRQQEQNHLVQLQQLQESTATTHRLAVEKLQEEQQQQLQQLQQSLQATHNIALEACQQQWRDRLDEERATWQASTHRVSLVTQDSLASLCDASSSDISLSSTHRVSLVTQDSLASLLFI